ncbi:MAG: glycoside hydrolase family 78 protein [Tannerella sp.]|jgi:alpha-L-rhamnosidase|nr:glycoside hydrolase family 78 protein [Tannerella sp.]
MTKKILVGSLLLSLFACSQKSLTPVHLTCEYQTEPLGLAVETPRFSWQISDPAFTRGQKQTAYQLLVASSPELLTERKADVWNSGKVASEQSVLVPFEGKKLISSHEYFWKVQTYDKDGLPSAWSKPARFVTGIFDPAEWEAASWLKHPAAARTQHIWFRKTFHISDKSGLVVAHVASLGHHELYVNGKKADDRALAPALTDFQKRLFYVSYDISGLLDKGKNVIAVWFASGWASYDCFKMQPCLKVLVSGGDLALNSDTSWRCAVSNSSDTQEIFTFNHNGGETVDARSFIHNWNTIDYDDSKWEDAAVTDNDIELDAHDIDPSRIIETIPAVSVTDAGDGIYKVDFGKNFTGWINARFHGLAEGDTVTIGSADDDKEFADFNICNYFISSGKDGEQFQNRFNYLAGRYVNLKGLKQRPDTMDFTALAISTDMKRTGHFHSSNELFNKIYETDLWTFLANTQEGYTSDCPHRERCGYGEVATATSWGIGLPSYDAGAFYRNVVRNWRDVQTADGWGRHTAPQPNDVHWGGAMWSSAGMNVAEHHWQHYGDRKIIKIIYPTACRWLAFLHANMTDGLLQQYRRHNNGQFLGDWLAPGSRNEFGTSVQAQYFNNCVYVMNLKTMIRFAKALDKQDDIALYSARLDSLRPAVHARFYHPDSAYYCTNTQVQNAFALLTEITPEHERAKVAATIHNDMNGAHPYFDMGSSGLPVLLKYIVAHPEEASSASKILNRTTFPGFGYFISQGETTWPEDWKIDVPSKIHTCYTGIAGWFVKGLCGIQPDELHPGYKSFIIRPAIVDEANFAEASVESPYGKIFSRWERTVDGQLALSVIIPPNTEATVYIPATTPDEITENGVPLYKVEGITLKGVEEPYVIVSAKAGQYALKIHSL